jgi:hypothetical protein
MTGIMKDIPSFDDPPAPGEYQVIVSIGGQPIYGDVIIIE